MGKVADFNQMRQKKDQKTCILEIQSQVKKKKGGEAFNYVPGGP